MKAVATPQRYWVWGLEGYLDKTATGRDIDTEKKTTQNSDSSMGILWTGKQRLSQSQH